ncbi:nucleotidyltransferase domain-containing protein [Desulfitobacterium sp. AusDCA]|uniref:nucleotidyltransferase domain-containing protein n=1 Tax=Desulfitobacterium sp. AusDCA TaxID=3240383 RepID=UPI003DA70B30
MSTELLSIYKGWSEVINCTQKTVKGIQALICFGSRVLQTAEEESDYDIMVIVELQPSLAEQRVINSLLEQACEYRIHATLLTLKAFESGMRMSPYIHLAYKTGVAVVGADLLKQHVRPLAKLGILNELNNIKTEVEIYEEDLKDDPDYGQGQSRSLLKALRSALALKHLITNWSSPTEISLSIKRGKGATNQQMVEQIKAVIYELDDLILKIKENESDHELEARICG